jgi:hypothetical protein
MKESDPFIFAGLTKCVGGTQKSDFGADASIASKGHKSIQCPRVSNNIN